MKEVITEREAEQISLGMLRTYGPETMVRTDEGMLQSIADYITDRLELNRAQTKYVQLRMKS